MAKMRIEEFDLADEGRKYRRRVKRNSGRNSVGDGSGNSGGNGGGNGGDGAVQTVKVETGAGTTRNGTTRKTGRDKAVKYIRTEARQKEEIEKRHRTNISNE